MSRECFADRSVYRMHDDSSPILPATAMVGYNDAKSWRDSYNYSAIYTIIYIHNFFHHRHRRNLLHIELEHCVIFRKLYAEKIVWYIFCNPYFGRSFLL